MRSYAAVVGTGAEAGTSFPTANPHSFGIGLANTSHALLGMIW